VNLCNSIDSDLKEGSLNYSLCLKFVTLSASSVGEDETRRGGKKQLIDHPE